MAGSSAPVGCRRSGAGFGLLHMLLRAETGPAAQAPLCKLQKKRWFNTCYLGNSQVPITIKQFRDKMKDLDKEHDKWCVQVMHSTRHSSASPISGKGWHTWLLLQEVRGQEK